MGDAGGRVLRAVSAEGVAPPDPATNTLERATVSAPCVHVYSVYHAALQRFQHLLLLFLVSLDKKRVANYINFDCKIPAKC